MLMLRKKEKKKNKINYQKIIKESRKIERIIIINVIRRTRQTDNLEGINLCSFKVKQECFSILFFYIV